MSIALPFCLYQHSNNWMLQGFLKIKANGTKTNQKTFKLKSQIWVCQNAPKSLLYHFALADLQTDAALTPQQAYSVYVVAFVPNEVQQFPMW